MQPWSGGAAAAVGGCPGPASSTGADTVQAGGVGPGEQQGQCWWLWSGLSAEGEELPVGAERGTGWVWWALRCGRAGWRGAAATGARAEGLEPPPQHRGPWPGPAGTWQSRAEVSLRTLQPPQCHGAIPGGAGPCPRTGRVPRCSAPPRGVRGPPGRVLQGQRLASPLVGHRHGAGGCSQRQQSIGPGQGIPWAAFMHQRCPHNPHAWGGVRVLGPRTPSASCSMSGAPRGCQCPPVPG